MAEESQTLALSEQNRKSDPNYVEGPVHEGPDFGDEDGGKGKSSKGDGVATLADEDSEVEEFIAKPFESFTDLPEDVLDALNAFKIAIITHKTAEWEDVSRDDMMDLLDALKQLVRTTT